VQQAISKSSTAIHPAITSVPLFQMQLLAFMHSRTLPTSFSTAFVDCHFKQLKFIGVKRAAAEPDAALRSVGRRGASRQGEDVNMASWYDDGIDSCPATGNININISICSRSSSSSSSGSGDVLGVRSPSSTSSSSRRAGGPASDALSQSLCAAD